MTTLAPRVSHAFSAPSMAMARLESVRLMSSYASAFWQQSLGRPLSRDLPAGNGRPVVVAPGLGCNHRATHMLCSALRSSGFEVQDWGGGRNLGPVTTLEHWMEPMVESIRHLHAKTGRKVAVIGWSLGGIAAREISRMRDIPVDSVITLATPFADLEATNVGGVYDMLNGAKPAWQTSDCLARLAQEPPVSGVSIHSKEDGLVSWEACIQQKAKRTRNIEVTNAGHFGMVVCPKVLVEVHRELATQH
jgi:alpha-beta hydrolase superfamily lysophospholipase